MRVPPQLLYDAALVVGLVAGVAAADYALREWVLPALAWWHFG